MGDAIGARVALVSDINPAELKSIGLRLFLQMREWVVFIQQRLSR
jgi:hypothetical protein